MFWQYAKSTVGGAQGERGFFVRKLVWLLLIMGVTAPAQTAEKRSSKTKPQKNPMNTLVTLSRSFVEFGPFTPAEILDFHKRGLLQETDHLLDAGSETWLHYAEWLPKHEKPKKLKLLKTPKTAAPAKKAKKAA
jgi:hypothetical protein